VKAGSKEKIKPDAAAVWPAAQVEMWPIARIKPYDNNPRTHPEDQIEVIAKSMIQDGVTAPIFVDEEGVIIYGHGRRLAALKCKFRQYPVIIARGWTEDRKRAVRIKDNQLGLLSGWDMVELRGEIASLQSSGYDLPLLGFGDQMTSWLTSDGELVLDPNSEWNGMPRFDQRDKTAFKSIVVHFKDQAAVDDFAKLIKQKITADTRMLWFPEIEIETYVDKRYISK
jgi:hypothetical protein